jgi:hypothetical protein
VATQLDSPCFTDAPPIAAEVARGVSAVCIRNGMYAWWERQTHKGSRAEMDE